MHIGIIGAGNIGSVVAKQFIAAGHDIIIANSRGPETLSDLVAQLGPHATAATAAEAAEQGDVVVATIPLFNRAKLPVEQLKGKIVIDTMNYYPARDGHIPELDNHTSTTAELTAQILPESNVVKAFNSIIASEIESTARPEGAPDRRTLPIAGDDAEAKHVVTELINSIGFDVLDAGDLHQGIKFENGTPAYCQRVNRTELQALLDRTAA